MTPADIRKLAHDIGENADLRELRAFRVLLALADVVEAGHTYIAVFGNTEESDIAAFRFDQALARVEAL